MREVILHLEPLACDQFPVLSLHLHRNAKLRRERSCLPIYYVGHLLSPKHQGITPDCVEFLISKFAIHVSSITQRNVF